MKRLVLSLALLFAVDEAAAGDARPALPGANTDLLARAASFATEASAPDDSALLTRDRLKRWAPPLALGIAAGTVALAADPPRNARWNDRNEFDDEISDALSAGSRSGRHGAAIASTVVLASLAAGLSADIYLLRDELPLEQSLVVALTASAANGLLTESVKVAAGRERPYARPCRSDPRFSESCDSGSDDNASFFSFHASQSATLAGLLCVRHLRRSGAQWRDRLICGAAAAASLATGLLRVSADEHYFTDVLAGWGSGVVFGAALPLLFPEWSGSARTGLQPSVMPLAGPGGLGLQFSATF